MSWYFLPGLQAMKLYYCLSCSTMCPRIVRYFDSDIYHREQRFIVTTREFFMPNVVNKLVLATY